MAQNEIFRPGLNALLRRSLTIKGDAPPSPFLAAEIVPVLNLENDRPEYLFLAGERRGTQHQDMTAVAAQFSKAVLENPLGSGLIMVVESITFEFGTLAGFGYLYFADPTVTTNVFIGGAPNGPFASTSTDFRWARRDATGIAVPTMAGLIWTLQSAVDFSGFFLTDSNVADHRYTDFIGRTGPIILPPGWKLGVRPGVVNQGMCVEFVWRERPLEPGEFGVNMLG